MKTRKKLLLLGAGSEQVTAIHIAQELGYFVIAFDNQEMPPGAIAADQFRQVNLKNSQELFAAAAEVAPDGVFCHAAELAIPVAILADAMGLPGIGEEAARRATDKRLRVEALHRHGINTPRFQILTAAAPEEQWLQAFSRLGAPAVCKPPDLAGARGVEMVRDADAVLSYRDRRGGVNAESFIMESWIDGVQYSTESVIINGRIAHTAIALRHYDTTLSLRPFLIEDGHSIPDQIDEALRIAIDDVTARCAEAIGVRCGVLKGDIIVTPEGQIVVLEMAARTSGGRFADTVVPRATGVNILYPLIQMAMNERPDESFLKQRWSRGVSQRFFFPPPNRTLAAAPGLVLCSQTPGVLDVWFNRKLLNGQPIPEVRCHGDRAGYVICTGETQAEADALALSLTRSIPFEFANS